MYIRKKNTMKLLRNISLISFQHFIEIKHDILTDTIKTKDMRKAGLTNIMHMIEFWVPPPKRVLM